MPCLVLAVLHIREFPMLNTNVCALLVVLEQIVTVRIITQAVQSKPLHIL